MNGHQYLTPTGLFPPFRRYKPFGLLDTSVGPPPKYHIAPYAYALDQDEEVMDVELPTETQLWDALPSMPALTWRGEFSQLDAQSDWESYAGTDYGENEERVDSRRGSTT